jgi:hypothetical protein
MAFATHVQLNIQYSGLWCNPRAHLSSLMSRATCSAACLANKVLMSQTPFPTQICRYQSAYSSGQKYPGEREG